MACRPVSSTPTSSVSPAAVANRSRRAVHFPDRQRLPGSGVLAPIPGRPGPDREVTQQGDLRDVLLEDQTVGLATPKLVYGAPQLSAQRRISDLVDQVVELRHSASGEPVGSKLAQTIGGQAKTATCHGSARTSLGKARAKAMRASLDLT